MPTLTRLRVKSVRLVPTAIALLLLAAPLAARAQTPPDPAERTGSVDHDESRFRWALLTPKDDITASDTDRDDWRTLRAILDDESAPVFWFRLDSGACLVRDPKLVARAREIVKPLLELGRRQGALGAKQAKLGALQASLGEKQAQLGARQADLAAKHAYYAARHTSDPQMNHDLMELAEEMRALGQRQHELASQQAPLGEVQGQFGREQGAMGRERRGVTRKAGAELRELAERALREGKAERVLPRRAA